MSSVDQKNPDFEEFEYPSNFTEIRSKSAARRKRKASDPLVEKAKHIIQVILREVKDDHLLKRLKNIKLDTEQLSFLNSDHKIDLIGKASPGCGKTTTLIFRIIKLLSLGVKPKEILTTTFTRKGREEFSKKYDYFMDRGLREDKPYFMTFHSFCTEFLRNKLNKDEEEMIDEEEEKYELSFMNQEDVNKILKKVKKKLYWDITIKSLQKLINQIRFKESQDPSFHLQLPPIFSRAIKEFEQLMKDEHKLDYFRIVDSLQKEIKARPSRYNKISLC